MLSTDHSPSCQRRPRELNPSTFPFVTLLGTPSGQLSTKLLIQHHNAKQPGTQFLACQVVRSLPTSEVAPHPPSTAPDCSPKSHSDHPTSRLPAPPRPCIARRVRHAHHTVQCDHRFGRLGVPSRRWPAAPPSCATGGGATLVVVWWRDMAYRIAACRATELQRYGGVELVRHRQHWLQTSLHSLSDRDPGVISGRDLTDGHPFIHITALHMSSQMSNTWCPVLTIA